MEKIKLTQGYYALVDDENYEFLNCYKWHLDRRSNTNYASGYIKGKHIFMHRLIMGIEDKSKPEIDHINSDGLDNQRCNLRIATHSQNNMNRRKQYILKGLRTSSIYKGVIKKKGCKRWYSRAILNGEIRYLGSFKTEEEAALAYNAFAEEHYSEFARLNEV